MAKIVQRGLRYPVPPAPNDIVSHKLYYGASPITMDYNLPSVNFGIPPVVNGSHLISLSAIPEIAALAEGNYDFGVTFVDDAGNEGDFSEVENVPLDIQPPPAPGPIEVVEL